VRASANVQPLRWGIVGASDIADRVMAPAMAAAAAARLVAVASRSRERGSAFGMRHGIAPSRVFASAAALSADPEVDVVYVATEVDRHADDVMAVAAAGKDVLVEKPIARSATEGQAMVDACARAGVRLGTCFYQRENARHRRLRELVAAGAIGRVTAVTMSFSGRSPERPGAWRQDPRRSGGGPFIDMGSHCVDLLRFLLETEVRQVSAFTATLAAGYAAEDTAFALLTLASGIPAVIGSHWSVTDPADSRSSVVQIGGTDGTLVAYPLHDKFSRGTLLIANGGGEDVIPVPEQSTHVALLGAIAAARAAGRPFPVTGEDGVAAQRVVDAVYESGRTGQPVTLA
jgi:1,5-anhydro-D-fructose reductase (1,5-anhydro-D-mannitol-forming)